MSYELRNSALTATALAYNSQAPLDPKKGTFLGDIPPVPPGLDFPDEAHYRLTFHAPNAKTVTLRRFFEELPLEKEADGFWRITLPIGPGGLMPVSLQVDGNLVINPMLPIGFGASTPCNMIELPGKEDFFYLKEVPHGVVSHRFFPSTVTGRTESCLVYTPPGYEDSAESYPVLYLQHGHGENEGCWFHQGKVNFIADNLIAAGEAEKCIIVMNNGMVQKRDDQGGIWVDMTALPELLVKDCIPFIEQHYRVRPGRENRAMAGLSMGSMHTSILTLSHPELFAWAGIFSGFVQPLPIISPENGYMTALDNREITDSFRLFFRAMGEADPFFSFFTSDRKLLEEKGLAPDRWAAHEEAVYPGSHDWNVWRLCARDFLKRVFR